MYFPSEWEKLKNAERQIFNLTTNRLPPPVTEESVCVAGRWYLCSRGSKTPATSDMLLWAHMVLTQEPHLEARLQCITHK